MNEDMKPTVLKWASEYNALYAKGADMLEEMKKMSERMQLLRDSIDDAIPDSYDEIALLFGGTIEIDDI